MDYDWLPIYEAYFDIGRSSGEAPVKCAMHDDARASATVNLDTGLFFCHVCNVGGDAIQLVMEVEGLNYLDAVKHAEGLLANGGRPLRSRATFERYSYGVSSGKGDRRKRRPFIPSWKGR